jgi:hypothetical protein
VLGQDAAMASSLDDGLMVYERRAARMGKKKEKEEESEMPFYL